MGFMTRSEAAERLQEKLDEAQKNFNAKRGARSRRRARSHRARRRQFRTSPAAGAHRARPAGRSAAEPIARRASAPPAADAPAATDEPAATERPSRSRADRIPAASSPGISSHEPRRHPHRDGHALRRATAAWTRTPPCALIHHLLENGSDGLVVAGTTGEGATMTDEEKLAPVGARPWPRPATRRSSRAPASTTPPLGRAHRAGHRDRRRRDAGGHAVLQQAQPARDRGALRGGRRGHRPADRRSTTSRRAA